MDNDTQEQPGAQGEPDAEYTHPAFNYRDGRYTNLIEPGELARARPGEKTKRDRRAPARQMQDDGAPPLFPLDNL